jgi:ParB-like chromosome segregation protein Spo0J
VLLPLADLTLYARNARSHPPEQLARLADSLRRFGFVAPVLVDANGVVVAGHGRLEAARQVWAAGGAIPRCTAGMVPALAVEHLTDEQVRAYRIADNKLASLSMFDAELLAAELSDLAGEGFDAGLLGFTDADLRRFAAPGDDPGTAFGEPVATGADPYSLLTFSCLVTPQQRAAIDGHLTRLRASFGGDSLGSALVSASRRFLDA